MICPLRQEECRTDCAWYYGNKLYQNQDGNPGECSIVIIASNLHGMLSEYDDPGCLGNLNGLTDALKDIGRQLFKIWSTLPDRD